jgi:hypothetical protein
VTYLPSLNTYLLIEMIFEFPQNGYISPTKLKIMPFKTDELTRTNSIIILCLNIVRLILCIQSIYMIPVKIKYREVLPGYIASILRDIIQLSLSIAPVCLMFVIPSFDSNALLENPENSE